MVCRKDLKNLASGLHGSFMSRNNDVDGYWGVGKLCLHAKKSQIDVVRLDLFPELDSLDDPGLLALVAGRRADLKKRLLAKNMSADWVAAACIELDFNPPSPSGRFIPITTWGRLYRLTVAIVDDRHKLHAVSGYGYCAPHDPVKESRSARA